MGIWPILRAGRPVPEAASHHPAREPSGSTAIITSASGANSSHDCCPDTATPSGTERSGRSQILAASTRKWVPLKLTYPPSSRSRMMHTASASISWRWSASGQPPPMTCSLRFSPAPSPRVNRPSLSTARVAACCATTAGWYRIVGHVT